MLDLEGMDFYILNFIVMYKRINQDARHYKQPNSSRIQLDCCFSEFRVKYLVDILYHGIIIESTTNLSQKIIRKGEKNGKSCRQDRKSVV